MTYAPTNPSLKLGAALVGSSRGISRDEMIGRQARAAVMSSAEAVPFRRELCKIAAAAYEMDGTPNAPAAILFRNLAKSATWHAAYNRFTDYVLRGLSKQGSALLPAAAALHDKAGGGIFKTLTATGALGGAALGSLAFLMARNSDQTSAENAELLEKVRAYRQLKKDIEEDMANELPPTTNAGSGRRYDV